MFWMLSSGLVCERDFLKPEVLRRVLAVALNRNREKFYWKSATEKFQITRKDSLYYIGLLNKRIILTWKRNRFDESLNDRLPTRWTRCGIVCFLLVSNVVNVPLMDENCKELHDIC